MTNSSVFLFEEHLVRFVGTADKPEWIAEDICLILGLGDTHRALESLDTDEKGRISALSMNSPATKGLRQSSGRVSTVTMLTVTEPGIYHLIFKSRKPEAKLFRRWVTHELLPAIRKGAKVTPNTLPHPELNGTWLPWQSQLVSLLLTAISEVKEPLPLSHPLYQQTFQLGVELMTALGVCHPVQDALLAWVIKALPKKAS